jgi:hypothetical protein
MNSCHHCGFVFPEKMPISRSSECPSCSFDVRVCKNCKHYAPGYRYDCKESIQELQADKERATFCDWFSLIERVNCTAQGLSKTFLQESSARARFDALFGSNGTVGK